MEMNLTFLYPIFNRRDLFKNTLDSFLDQDGHDAVEYEILVLDDGSSEEGLLPMLKDFRDKGLPIKYIRIDSGAFTAYSVYRLPSGANNPAIALNVGLRLSRTEGIVLSSPEVRHIKSSNLTSLITYPLLPRQWLCCNVWDGALSMFIGGGPQNRAFNFLSLHYVQDLFLIGGIADERFMGGWAWEDTDLIRRLNSNGIKAIFSGDAIAGSHQHHLRPGVDEPSPGGFIQALIRNQKLYNETDKQAIANVGHEWGDLSLITEQWP